MKSPRERVRKVTRTRLAVLVAAGACVSLLLAFQLPAGALTVTETPTPVTGSATWFDALGSPYGGCGLPQADLDSQHFIALNVYNTPGDYAFYTRPMPEGDAKIGMWNNGHNCGRWVKVTISDYCTGTNDGAPNQAFCRNGEWVEDAYNGATLNMLVADSCGDSNAWCRDDPYHIDLAHASLNQFVKNGTAVGDMDPAHFNNRHVTWQFIPAPDYTGDIKIGFLQSAQAWWAAISVSHLANGIHGVEYLQGGAWQQAKMNGDMGQSFIISGTTAGSTDFQIRVRDASDQLINNGRVYSFSLPASCGSSCGTAYTAVSYTTDGPSPTIGPTTVQPTTPPVTTPPVTTRPPTTPPTTNPPTTRPPTTPPATTVQPTTPPVTTGCAATYTTSNSWPGGFQGQVTVNAGSSAINGWTVTWTLDSGQSISQVWSGTLTPGSPVSVSNASWNGSLAAGASTTFGFVASGSPSTPTLTCTSR